VVQNQYGSEKGAGELGMLLALFYIKKNIKAEVKAKKQ